LYLNLGNKTLCDYCNSKNAKRARQKKEKEILVQAQSVAAASVPDGQNTTVEEPQVHHDSQEGENSYKFSLFVRK
jgi:hypothetical protein